MNYTLIDLPKPVDRAVYDRALDHMADALALRPEVRAVYQVGGVSTPGISDLDVVVVFKDGATCTLDPLRDVPGVDRYLFVHGLFGTSAVLTVASRPYSLFHNARQIRGEAAELPSLPTASAALQRQVALEYLLRLYVALAIQRAYGVVKVRGFLLHAKAVGYDLDFLGVTSGRMREVTDDLIDRRQQWFSSAPSSASIVALVEAFADTLGEFLAREWGPFYLPTPGPYRLARGVELTDGPGVRYRHRGLCLPRSLARSRPTVYYGLQRRLNRFAIQAPIETDGMPTEVAARFEMMDRVQRYNAEHLPHFAGLGLSLLSS